MNPTKKFFSKIGFNYLILGITALIFQILIINILNITNPIYLSDINFLTVLSSICNYILPFPLFYWLMKKLDVKKPEKNSINIKTFIIYIGITLTLMWIGNLIGLAITTLLSGAIQNEIANPVQNLINSTNIWINLIIISIIGPVFEEILFRKLLIDRTIRYGAGISIILSATLFALFHGNLNQFFYALLMGGFLAYVYINTGKITYSIILHMIVNFMGSIVSLFVAQSAMNLQTAFSATDIAILLGYLLFMAVTFLIGVYGLIKFRPKRPELPLKTVFLNYGMICFIGFFIIEIVYQMMM